MTELEKYRFELPVTVRFADLDAMGHLNNVTYLVYTEQARILYVRQVCQAGSDWSELGMILARTEIDYKLPIAFDDVVKVYNRVSRLGSKSFDFSQIITRQRNHTIEIAALSSNVMVAYDYQQEKAITIPEKWRKNILAYEPAL